MFRLCQGIIWSIAIVTPKLYGDESSDQKKQRVFAVSGVFGSEEEWEPAIRKWLFRNRGLEFHAVECSDIDLYSDLTDILAESQLGGVSVSIDLRSHKKYLSDTIWGIEYYKCFIDVVSSVATMVKRFNDDPGENVDAKIEFTFDSRKESDGSAAIVYEMFRNLPEWKDTRIFDTAVKFEGGPEPRLEIADLLVREAMKELDRKILSPDSTSGVFFQKLHRAAIDGQRKFIWIEHDEEYLREWRRVIDQPMSQQMKTQYADWLSNTGRIQNGIPHDNIANRSQFYTWLIKKEALESNVKSRQ